MVVRGRAGGFYCCDTSHAMSAALGEWAGDDTVKVALNQSDRLSEADLTQVNRSLKGILAAEGHGSAVVHAISAVTGRGLDGLAEDRVVVAGDRVDPGEDEALPLYRAGAWTHHGPDRRGWRGVR